MLSWLALGGILLLGATLFRIRQIRNSGITGEKTRNKYFRQLASQLQLNFVTDDYFVQLEGIRNGRQFILYPHNFEGPGLVTLLYLHTTVPAHDQNWIEPNLSLGRALVEWQRHVAYGYEIKGNDFAGEAKDLLSNLEKLNSIYPYIAITHPERFSYSPLLQQTLRTWKNYTVFIAIDAGKRPGIGLLEQALSNASSLAQITAQSVTFSDTTG